MRVLPNVGSFGSAAPEEILRPARPSLVLLSLLHGVLLTLIPAHAPVITYRALSRAPATTSQCSPGPRLLAVRHQQVRHPQSVVGDATVFGQHALAYAVLAYGAEYFRRRVLRFPLWQQAVQVAALLVLCALIVLLVRFVGGAALPRWTYLVPPLVAALLWPLVSVLLQSPQRPSHSASRR